MEHLTRNTNNDRLIYTIENNRKEEKDKIDKRLKEFINRIETISTGILSSIISAGIVSIWKNEQKFPCYLLFSTIMFLVITIVFWLVMGKWLVPKLNELFFKPSIDITPEKESVSVQRFNAEIMQKVAEITEIIDVIKTTKATQCKTLNFVISLYKLQEIVDFMYINFISEKKEIRKLDSQQSVELLKYSFNIYTVAAALKAVRNIQKEMEDLIKNDTDIKNLEGIELLKSDLSKIGDKLKKVNISN